jgi:hypothetical protein
MINIYTCECNAYWLRTGAHARYGNVRPDRDVHSLLQPMENVRSYFPNLIVHAYVTKLLGTRAIYSNILMQITCLMRRESSAVDTYEPLLEQCEETNLFMVNLRGMKYRYTNDENLDYLDYEPMKPTDILNALYR